MSSRFDRYDRLAGKAVDWLNAEPFTLYPMMKIINGRARRDPERLTVNAKGVFAHATEEKGLQLGVRKSYREANDLRALQVGRTPQLSVDRYAYFPDIAQLPRQGDIVKFEDATLPDYKIASARPDGHSRILLKLVATGATPGFYDESEAQP